MLEPDDLAKWRQVFDGIRRRPDAKVGLMKLGARVPKDRIYAVAVRDSPREMRAIPGEHCPDSR
jgi:hypothetical protein